MQPCSLPAPAQPPPLSDPTLLSVLPRVSGLSWQEAPALAGSPRGGTQRGPEHLRPPDARRHLPPGPPAQQIRAACQTSNSVQPHPIGTHRASAHLLTAPAAVTGSTCAPPSARLCSWWRWPPCPPLRTGEGMAGSDWRRQTSIAPSGLMGSTVSPPCSGTARPHGAPAGACRITSDLHRSLRQRLGDHQ